MIGYFSNKLKIYFWLAVALLLSSNLILTQSYAEQSIEELANSGLLKSQGMASSEESGEAIPNYSKSEVENEANNLDNLDDAEMRTKSEQKMGTADSNSAEGITRDSNTKTIKGFENQEIFTKADKINEDPISAYERMTSEGCKEKENQQKPHYKKVTKKELVTDIEIYEETCEMPAGNIVCEKTLSVTCDDNRECSGDNGGIEGGSVASDMKFVYRYPYLTVGTISDNYWNGRCQEYSRRTTFTVKDKARVKEFRIVRVGYDDYLQIKVNGSQVYNGPKGGYKLETTGGRGFFGGSSVDTGNGVYGCELDTNWNFGVDIDLRSYLRDGENTIDTKVIVAGRGEGWMEIIASQYCCRSFSDKWEKRCWEQ